MTQPETHVHLLLLLQFLPSSAVLPNLCHLSVSRIKIDQVTSKPRSIKNLLNHSLSLLHYTIQPSSSFYTRVAKVALSVITVHIKYMQSVIQSTRMCSLECLSLECVPCAHQANEKRRCCPVTLGLVLVCNLYQSYTSSSQSTSHHHKYMSHHQASAASEQCMSRKHRMIISRPQTGTWLG